LPSAEYNLDSAVEINDVRDMAQAAAAATGKNCSIIVTKADGPRYVYNLPVLRQRVL